MLDYLPFHDLFSHTSRSIPICLFVILNTFHVKKPLLDNVIRVWYLIIIILLSKMLTLRVSSVPFWRVAVSFRAPWRPSALLSISLGFVLRPA
jgi:hypothetical protein